MDVTMADPRCVFKRFPLVEVVTIPGRYLNRNVAASVKAQLQNCVEGVCSRHGLIRPGSVIVHHIGPGKTRCALGGDVAFRTEFDGDVCNPVVGSNVICRIEAIGPFAAFAVNSGGTRALEVIIPPVPKTFDHQIPYDDLQVGQEVVLRIVGKRYHLGQVTIVCAGQLLDEAVPRVEIEHPKVPMAHGRSDGRFGDSVESKSTRGGPDSESADDFGEGGVDGDGVDEAGDGTDGGEDGGGVDEDGGGVDEDEGGEGDGDLDEGDLDEGGEGDGDGGDIEESIGDEASEVEEGS